MMFKKAYLLTILVYLYIPLFIIILYSFNTGIYSSEWHGFSLHWYRILFEDRALLEATERSIWLAASTAIGSCTLATIAAIALFQYRFIGKQFLFSLLLTLIIIPDILFGIALLLVYNSLQISLGYWSLLGAHISFSFPFVLMIILARLKDFDKNIIEAAQDLGASDMTILRKILLPLLLPAIFSGGMLAIALSFDDVIISYFVSGPSYEILPLRIFSLVKMGIKPEINALFSLILIVTLAIAWLSYHFNREIVP